MTHKMVPPLQVAPRDPTQESQHVTGIIALDRNSNATSEAPSRTSTGQASDTGTITAHHHHQLSSKF